LCGFYGNYFLHILVNITLIQQCPGNFHSTVYFCKELYYEMKSKSKLKSKLKLIKPNKQNYYKCVSVTLTWSRMKY